MFQCESPEDPTNRYYRAFPALSAKDLTAKEQRHQSSKICLTVPKSLTWPHVNSVVSLTGNKGGSAVDNNYSSLGFGGNTAGVKRKPKRRRNQAISKGKSSYGRKYNISATTTTNNNNNNNCSGGVAGNSTSGGKKKNNSIHWDTEFEGAWEMGRDLIREFVMKQNNRNRSISESDASKFVEINDMIEAKKRNSDNCSVHHHDDNLCNDDGTLLLKNMFAAAASAAAAAATDNNLSTTDPIKIGNIMTNAQYHQQSPAIINDTSILLIGNNVMRQNKGYATPDTLTSLTEIDNISAPRRLYERDVSNETAAAATAATDDDDAHHLAQFEAKFNRSVEALWDDNNDDDEIETNANKHSTSISNAAASEPLNADSFWYNYYKHRYNSDDGDEEETAKLMLKNNLFGEPQPATTQYQLNSINEGIGGLASLKDSIWSATDRTDENLMLQQSSSSTTSNLWDSGVELNNSLQTSQVNNNFLRCQKHEIH